MFKKFRQKFFENIRKNDYCFRDLDDKNKTVLLFTNKDESVICQLAKFVYDSFKEIKMQIKNPTPPSLLILPISI